MVTLILFILSIVIVNFLAKQASSKKKLNTDDHRHFAGRDGWDDLHD
jgi:hypothetical protein